MITNSRSNDPVTSKIAGIKLEESGKGESQRQITLKAVRKYQGLTSAELANFCNLDRYMVARRLHEIPEIGQGRIRICTVTNHLCVTWWLKQDKRNG
jgi:hypothetical protein